MLTFSEKNALAHQLGAHYENGYWIFPSAAVRKQFDRIVIGMEWSPAVRERNSRILEKNRDELAADRRDLPEVAGERRVADVLVGHVEVPVVAPLSAPRVAHDHATGGVVVAHTHDGVTA